MSNEGLENVVVGNTSICAIDGEKGELRYRGYRVEDLCEHASFEETAWLLWNGDLPTSDELAELVSQLASRREISQAGQFLIHGLASRCEPMDALRTAVSAMAADDESLADNAPADIALSRERGLRITAMMPVILANYWRARIGEAAVEPDPELGLAGNLLFMLSGKRPTTEEAEILDDCLILHAEHGFNASTFAARVVCSTLTDMYSAITAAIASLKGPLHGGANTRVMNMLLEIGDEDRVDEYIEKAFAEKQRIMGFGHRVYKVDDPRARVLARLCERIGELRGEPKWYRLSKRVQEAVQSRKPLVTNVDFFSAATYYSLGIAPELYTPVFAVSRIVGWAAHVLEQYEDNRLIRPRARWIGPDARDFVPIADRS